VFAIRRQPRGLRGLQLLEARLEVDEALVFVLNAPEVLEHGFDRAAVFLFETLDGHETIFDLLETRGIVTRVLGEIAERAADVLNAIERVLEIVGDAPISSICFDNGCSRWSARPS
jgi:hypothetical protein